MPCIQYHATNFPPRYGAALAGAHHLTVTWAELVWAAITVGKPGLAHLLSHGMHSISDMIVRSHTVYANLHQTGFYFEKSELYKDLDPTEKGAVSYFLGMMAAKIICSRLLDTPFVFHLSMLKTLGGTMILHTRSQPDLIGLNRAGNWVVAEAKGRTNGYSPEAMTKAKLQTRQLRMINGTYPSLRVGIQAYFSPDLNFAVSDPDEYEDNAEDIEFDLRAAIHDYYSYVLGSSQVARAPRKILGREYQFRTIEETGVSIGIDTATLKRLEQDGDFKAPFVFESAQIGVMDDEQVTVAFPDGLAVSLDQRWSESRMRRDPRARRGS
jgi:hypothetical protein